jgi:shikimate kinase
VIIVKFEGDEFGNAAGFIVGKRGIGGGIGRFRRRREMCAVGNERIRWNLYRGLPVDSSPSAKAAAMNTQNIVLIGMPGAGKSTIGVLLAKALGMGFMDTDLIIQEKEGRLLQEIINTQGVAQFIDIEARIIQQIEVTHCVIATGGSAVYNVKAVSRLQAMGKLFYLKLPYIEIEQRIRNMTSRGIAIEKGQGLIDLYQERIKLYEKYADIIVDCAGATIEETVQKMIDLIKEI